MRLEWKSCLGWQFCKPPILVFFLFLGLSAQLLSSLIQFYLQAKRKIKDLFQIVLLMEILWYFPYAPCKNFFDIWAPPKDPQYITTKRSVAKEDTVVGVSATNMHWEKNFSLIKLSNESLLDSQANESKNHVKKKKKMLAIDSNC